jgi:hypothetical protein
VGAGSDAALGIEASEVRKRFAELEGDSQP